MSLESIGQQTAVTCGSCFCNLFQNRFVAGSTLVISAVVSLIGTALLIVDIGGKLLPRKLQNCMGKHPIITQMFPAAVVTTAVSVLLARVLQLPMSMKPVVGIPIVVSVVITAFLATC